MCGLFSTPPSYMSILFTITVLTNHINQDRITYENKPWNNDRDIDVSGKTGNKNDRNISGAICSDETSFVTG